MSRYVCAFKNLTHTIWGVLIYSHYASDPKYGLFSVKHGKNQRDIQAEITFASSTVLMTDSSYVRRTLNDYILDINY